ncbi:MAG: ABC transporter ATP-binding protein [Epsilonproteobacteria bacterium]|nr:ABC transporter ATP-binding protein [Campylobacterota bacterium]
MWQFFKEYLPFYKNYKKEIIFATIGMILVSIATALIAYLIKPVLDEIFIKKDETLLYTLPLLIIFVYFLKGFGRFTQEYFVSFIGEDIIRELRNRFLSHILRFDIDYFKNIHSGELISRVVNDINRIQLAISHNLAALIRDTLMAIFLLGVVIYQNPKLALFTLITLPLMVIPIRFISKKLKRLSKESQKKTAFLNTHLSEIFKNIETIKAYNAKEYELNKFKNLNQTYLNTNIKIVKNRALLNPLLETLNAIMAAIVIVVGGREVIEGRMSVGAFFSFMTALFMMADPIRRISTTYSNLQDAVGANERLKEIFNKLPSINSGNKALESINNIEFENVTLKYKDKIALKNINYRVSKPKIVGVVGDSGGGKSSFISLLLRFYDPSYGRILFDKIDIKELKIEDLREKIAYIPQNIHIFNDTIAKNIAYGKEVDRKKLFRVLKEANLIEFVNSLKDKEETILNEGGSNLSGGQRQRVAIARALYKNPDILILDEATSALDNESEKAVMDTILRLKDKIIFIVAHRLSTIKSADEILVFKDGQIVCQGSKEELLSSCKEFQKLYKGR